MVTLLFIPLVISMPYFLHVIIMIFFYAALAGSWNLIGGYGGQFSLGHAAFLGLGAYTSTLLFIYFGLSPWLGMFAAGGIAMAASILIGYPCFRLRGNFYCLATIAFVELLRVLFYYFRGTTGGAMGLFVPYIGNSPLDFQFNMKAPYYYVALALMLATVYVTYWIDRSKIGYYLKAIREDQDAAESVGINPTKYKLIANLVSAFLAGATGTFYVQYLRFVDPEIFSIHISIDICLIPIVGGAGTVLGPILGSTILVPMLEFTNAILGGGYSGVHLIIYGFLLIAVVLMRPSGILGFFEKKYEALLRLLSQKD